ncbi:MAG: stimulus-sensing domain-containing protein [Pseudomonadota bacterium]
MAVESDPRDRVMRSGAFAGPGSGVAGQPFDATGSGAGHRAGREHAERGEPLFSLTGLGRALIYVVGSAISWLFLSSIARRIATIGVFLLCCFVGSIVFFSGQHAWLIKARKESLRVQGEIIAAAIAANATLNAGDQITLDPEKLPNVEDARIPFRDDAFAALELSLSADTVAPILRRLIKPTNTRARVYSRDGTEIADTANLFGRGGRTPAKPQAASDPGQATSLWAVLRRMVFPTDIPIYREAPGANGTAYVEVQMAMGGTATPMLMLNDAGQQMVSLAVPIRRQNTTQGVLLLSTQPGEIDRLLAREDRLIMLLAIMALVVTLLASWLLHKMIGTPMKRLAAAAEHVSQSLTAADELPDYSKRSDEVGQLSVAFAQMTKTLYARIAASDKFAADVAHELKNPLTAARATADALTFAKTDARRSELIEQIQGELQRLNRLIGDVSAISRLDGELALQETEPLDIADLARGVTDVLSDIYRPRNRNVAFALSGGAADDPRRFTVEGHEGRLSQVITNLVDNALSFTPRGGTVNIDVRRTQAHVEIAVTDNGPGIPPDKIDTIFERFYSDRPATEGRDGKNSGLGLSISREIVHAHRGEIWAENIGTPLAPQRRLAAGEVEAAEAGTLRQASVPTTRSHGARFVVRLQALGPAQRGRQRQPARATTQAAA